MANERISELAVDTLDGSELVPVVQGGTVTMRTTTQDIADLGGSGAGGVRTADFLFTETATADNLSFPLLATDFDNQQFTISGDHTVLFVADFNGYSIGTGVQSGADNWTVVDSSYNAGTNKTTITITDGIVADTTDDGAIVMGQYLATLDIPAGGTVLDVHAIGLSGWACNALWLSVGDTTIGVRSYFQQITAVGGWAYDATAASLDNGYTTLRSQGNDYKQASLSVMKAANSVVENTGPGVYYPVGDTITVEILTGLDPASMPLTPTGSTLVRVFYAVASFTEASTP